MSKTERLLQARYDASSREDQKHMLKWEKPSFSQISLGAEVTAYLGSDTDATPV